MSGSNTNSNEVIHNNLLVIVGSGLLLIGLINIFHIVLPPKFGQDPVWELTTLGHLVGISPIPIIGISFIFYGESRWTNLRLDKQVTRFFLLKNLSRLSLLLSIGYLSVLLIAASASTRLPRLASTSTSLSLSQKSSQTAQENLTNGNDINLLKDGDLAPVRSHVIVVDRINPSVASGLKPQNETQENLQVIQAKDHNRLFDQIGKWYVEAIVSTLVLFGIWYQTDWARNPARPRRKKSSHRATTPNLDNVDNEIQADDLDKEAT